MEEFSYMAFTNLVHLPGSVEEVIRKIKKNYIRGIHFYNTHTMEWEFSSYGEIFREGESIAAILADRGIQPGERVLLNAGSRRIMPSLWIGLFLAGAVPVPVPGGNPFTKGEEFLPEIQPLLSQFHWYICSREEEVVLKKVKNIKTICIDELEATPLSYTPFPPRVPESDEAYIYLNPETNNTGYIVTYKNFFAALYGMWSRLQLNPAFVTAASWLPLYSNMGLAIYLLGCMFSGVELYLLSPEAFRENPGNFIELLSDMRINFCSMPREALESILKTAPDNVEHLDLSALGWLGIDSKEISPTLLDDLAQHYSKAGLRKNALSPYYTAPGVPMGICMASALSGCLVLKEAGSWHVTYGRVIENLTMKISSDRKISVKGPCVIRKIIVKGETQDLLNENGYYETGDYGLIKDDKLIIRKAATCLKGMDRFPNIDAKRVS